MFLTSLRYEGTGRSLSLKLIDQLRKQSATTGGTGVTSKLRKIYFSKASVVMERGHVKAVETS